MPPDMPAAKLWPIGPRLMTSPPVMYSQPCWPTPSTTATAPLLRGTVIDLAGEPVAGAVVGTSAPPHADGAPFTGVWYSRNVVTDASGVFGFELIEKRPRECVIAEHPNYIQLAGRVTLDLAPGTNAVEVEARVLGEARHLLETGALAD